MTNETKTHPEAELSLSRGLRKMSDTEFLAAAKEIFLLHAELELERRSFV